jgi:hypothetical protein
MGGQGSGRPTSADSLLRQLAPQPIATPIPNDNPIVIPNLSSVQPGVLKNSSASLTASAVVLTDSSSQLTASTSIPVVIKTTADAPGADTEYFANILYNTDATPPAANTVPIGTIYVQYTA